MNKNIHSSGAEEFFGGGDCIAPPDEDRLLTEVDHLVRARLAPGVFDESATWDIRQNLVTAVQEAAMPYAVTTTEHEVVYDHAMQKRTFMWLGKTAVQTAMSGYQFHQHENALKRVDVEVAEARHATETLSYGKAQVFISPRMTRVDASLAEARQEHLGDDDAVRVSWLEKGELWGQKRKLQSLLVRDVPFEAWVEMLKDPNNIFGKSIQLGDETSALSVMEVFPELEVDFEVLPNGAVSVLENVVSYIRDEDARLSVGNQILQYYTDQEDLRRKAEFKADQWLDFEKELAESLADGLPTSTIKGFMASVQHQWTSKELTVIQSHQVDENLEYLMTRELVAMLEAMKRNILWGGAAVLTGNGDVNSQLQVDTQREIYQNEEMMFLAHHRGMDYHMLESMGASLIARSNIRVGGGCAGDSSRGSMDGLSSFASDVGLQLPGDDRDEQDVESGSSAWEWKNGVCQVKSCKTRPDKTEVGPCSVCKSCQHEFDNGRDPTKSYFSAGPSRAEPQTPVIESWMFDQAVKKLFQEEELKLRGDSGPEKQESEAKVLAVV